MFKREVDVLFIVEHADREVGTLSNIANRLASVAGLRSEILSVNFHLQKLSRIKPKLVVLPFVLCETDWPISLLHNLYGDGVVYLNFNWEQYLAPVNAEYKKPKDSFVRDVLKHIAWTEEFKSYLMENGVAEKNITVTGNAAYCLMRQLKSTEKDLRSMLAEQYGLDEARDWLFMPINYGWAFSPDKLINEKIRKGYDSEKAWGYRDYSVKCIREFLPFITEVAEKSDYEIILRPHPSITIEDYQSVFKEFVGYAPKNIHLNKGYTIGEWIVSSQLVGSSWSTSVWDAYNIGKPVFLFTPYEMPEWLLVWWNKRVSNVKNYQEFLALSESKTFSGSDENKNIDEVKNVIDAIKIMLEEANQISQSSTKGLMTIIREKKVIASLINNLLMTFYPSKVKKSLSLDYFKHIRIR